MFNVRTAYLLRNASTLARCRYAGCVLIDARIISWVDVSYFCAWKWLFFCRALFVTGCWSVSKSTRRLIQVSFAALAHFHCHAAKMASTCGSWKFETLGSVVTVQRFHRQMPYFDADRRYLQCRVWLRRRPQTLEWLADAAPACV